MEFKSLEPAYDSLPCGLKDRHTYHQHDASKTTTFMECPRKYFFQYVLGWRSVFPSIHLIHGEGWHRAQENLLLNGFSKESAVEALTKYVAYYREHFPNKLTDSERYPKNPLGTLEALNSYIKMWKDQKPLTVLATEIAGKVTISEDIEAILRLDSLVADDENIYSMDHKTGSRNSDQWRNQWQLSFQMSLYTHAVRCLPKSVLKGYENHELWGMIINGSIFLKSGNHAHVRVRVRKTDAQLAAWLWEATHWIEMIRAEWERLPECKESDPVLTSFPKNTTSCGNWGGCEFHNFCVMSQNPLKYVNNRPVEFNEEHWDPHAYATERAKLIIGKEEKDE